VLQNLSAWWLQWVIATLPGLINVVLAAKELERRCQKFPLFRPWQSSGFQSLIAIQFVIPVAVFWWIAPTVFRLEPPSPDRSASALFLWALALGFGFVPLMNAPISILSCGMVDIKPIYETLLAQAYEAIKRKQIDQTISFWQELEQELVKTPDFDVNRGLNYLKHYFRLNNEPTLDGENLDPQKSELDRQIKAIDQAMRKAGKVSAIAQLLQTDGAIARYSLPNCLRAFGCRQDFIKKYFPQASRQKTHK
jgi:hypothetical protein